MSDKKHTAEPKASDHDTDSDEVKDNTENEEKESEQPGNDLHSRSGDDYQGEAWQINENTKGD